MHSSHPAQIVIRAGLETDYPFVRVRHRVEELIELALSHFLLARLRVLDDEHHPQGNRGDERLEDRFEPAGKPDGHAEDHPNGVGSDD
jgi:hypothetical protein